MAFLDLRKLYSNESMAASESVSCRCSVVVTIHCRAENIPAMDEEGLRRVANRLGSILPGLPEQDGRNFAWLHVPSFRATQAAKLRFPHTWHSDLEEGMAPFHYIGACGELTMQESESGGMLLEILRETGAEASRPFIRQLSPSTEHADS